MVEKDVILVVCDKLSKMAYFVATTEKTLAKGLAHLFRDNIWRLQQIKHSVYWKGFTIWNNIWKKEKNLENAKKLVDEFEGRIEAEVRQQEEVEKKNLDKAWNVKLNPNIEEFRKSMLLEKYTAKILFGWDNGKFEDEYLKKLKRNWMR